MGDVIFAHIFCTYFQLEHFSCRHILPLVQQTVSGSAAAAVQTDRSGHTSASGGTPVRMADFIPSLGIS